MTSCPHTARTNAQRSRRQSRHGGARCHYSDLHRNSIAVSLAHARHGRNGTANAVWVRAHPGFKSPSLRSLIRAFAVVIDLGRGPASKPARASPQVAAFRTY
jgi:hypothetical protein